MADSSNTVTIQGHRILYCGVSKKDRKKMIKSDPSHQTKCTQFIKPTIHERILKKIKLLLVFLFLVPVTWYQLMPLPHLSNSKRPVCLRVCNFFQLLVLKYNAYVIKIYQVSNNFKYIKYLKNTYLYLTHLSPRTSLKPCI